MIRKDFLYQKYTHEELSVRTIARQLHCSESKVNYWLAKYGIQKRSISSAMYLKNNPDGDPFQVLNPATENDYFLFGLGLGLFWGEGNKVNKNSVRLGNTDPGVIKYFLSFLRRFYKIDETKLSFGIQIFNDIDSESAIKYWSRSLKVKRSQFQKPIHTPSLKPGTYRKRCPYGVVTIYFHNTKLRAIIMAAISELQQKEANVAQLVERVHGKPQ